MTFTLIPNSGQSLDDTRDGIRTNFSILRTAQNLNHGDIDTGDQGKHKFLQMPQQGTDPTTAANESAFYTKDSGGYPNFFIRNETNGQVYKLTAMDDANIATFGTNPGWTFLPGGLILKYGFINSVTSGTVNFSPAFPNNCFNIQVTPNSNSPPSGNATVAVEKSPTKNKFDWVFITSSAAYNGFFWTAIGN